MTTDQHLLAMQHRIDALQATVDEFSDLLLYLRDRVQDEEWVSLVNEALTETTRSAT